MNVLKMFTKVELEKILPEVYLSIKDSLSEKNPWVYVELLDNFKIAYSKSDPTNNPNSYNISSRTPLDGLIEISPCEYAILEKFEHGKVIEED